MSERRTVMSDGRGWVIMTPGIIGRGGGCDGGSRSTPMPTKPLADALDAMTALGAAWRGDWSEFDGRYLRDQLDELRAIIEKAASGTDVTADVSGFYEANGICAECHSWREYCYCKRAVGGVGGTTKQEETP